MGTSYYVDTRQLDGRVRVQLSFDTESRRKMLSRQADVKRADAGVSSADNVYDGLGAPDGERVRAGSLDGADDPYAAFIAQCYGPLSRRQKTQLAVETVGEAEALLLSFRKFRYGSRVWMTQTMKNCYARCEEELVEQLESFGYSVEWELPSKLEKYEGVRDEIWLQKAKKKTKMVKVKK